MRKNRICSGATDAEIAAVAMDWFRKIAREEENRGKKKKKMDSNGPQSHRRNYP